jgi:hypothetical protein
MPTPMRSLLEEISRDHFPYPPATSEEIEEFERRLGWKLDPELRAFYLHCDGAELIKQLPDCPYRILPLAEITRARVAIRGKDEDSRGPASMYAICDVQDGNYVLIDMSRQEHGLYPIIDGDHETWPNLEYCRQFARSFSEFLEGVLRARSPGYWLRG